MEAGQLDSMQSLYQENTPAHPMHICICVPSAHYDQLDFSAAVGDCLEERGHSTFRATEGDPRIVESDLVILVGDARRFTQSVGILRCCGENRPNVVLWQLESLPPVKMSNKARRIGLAIARCNRKNLPGPLSRAAQAVIPRCRDAQMLLRTALARSAGRELAKANPSYANVEPSILCHAMDRYYWFRRNYDPVWCDAVFASTPPRVEFLNDMGVPARYVPVGYHPIWGEQLDRKRDIDVLFFGDAINRTRRSALEQIRGQFAAAGVQFVCVTESVYGRERTELLNRARIVLDIMRTPWEMPVLRLLMCASCGAMVVSNWTGEPAPFDTGHLAQVDTDEMAEAAVHYLKHEPEWQAIAGAAQAFVTRELTMQRSLESILETIGAERPTSAELAGGRSR